MDIDGQLVEVFEPTFVEKGWNRAVLYIHQLTAVLYILSIRGENVMKYTRFVVQQK